MCLDENMVGFVIYKSGHIYFNINDSIKRFIISFLQIK